MTEKLKNEINEAADKLRGIDNLIPPAYVSEPSKTPIKDGENFDIFIPLVRTPFLDDRLLDCLLVVCSVLGIFSLGIVFGIDICSH